MTSRAIPERPRLTRDDVAAAREVAELLGIPMSTVFEYARRGVIPGHKLGRRWIFLHDEIEASLRCAPRTAGTRPEPCPPLLPVPVTPTPIATVPRDRPVISVRVARLAVPSKRLQLGRGVAVHDVAVLTQRNLSSAARFGLR
jgi:excisionase family DNA binding protein